MCIGSVRVQNSLRSPSLSLQFGHRVLRRRRQRQRRWWRWRRQRRRYSSSYSRKIVYRIHDFPTRSFSWFCTVADVEQQNKSILSSCCVLVSIYICFIFIYFLSLLSRKPKSHIRQSRPHQKQKKTSVCFRQFTILFKKKKFFFVLCLH